MTDAEPLAAPLAALMDRLGRTGGIGAVRRLSGGANLESWYFTHGGDGFVLRRAPSAEWTRGRQIDLAIEAQVIRRARAGGVAAPEVVADLDPADGLGIGFVMGAAAGTADPKTVIAEAAPEMIDDLARALAGIHRLAASDITLPSLDAAEGVERLATQFEGFGGDRPIVALGLAWLRANLPPPCPPCLNHGDLRIGNVMAAHGRVTAILDWELAHFGDPHEDLAFGCMAVWRFGAIDRPAFGIAGLERFFAAYEAAGGRTVDRDRFRFWLVYRTVWWALGCLHMGDVWREGSDRSIERVVIGRRIAEQELDLLLLLDEGDLKERLPAARPALPAAAGEPSAIEMLSAVSEWLAGAVKPKLEGRDRFNLAVAQNAIGIVGRELASPGAARDRMLAQRLLANEASLATPGLCGRLRRAALDGVAVNAPKYPSLRLARARWEKD